MDLATAVSMDKTDAAVKAAEYRRAVEETDDPAYRMIAEGYEALAKGLTMIDLPAAIRAGGLDDDGRPRLAAIRSDARVAFLAAWKDGPVRFTANDPWSERRADQLQMPMEMPHWINRGDGVGALVPIVPPEHRPRWHGNSRGRFLLLRSFVTLWEVGDEGWAVRDAVGRRAPRDPALLRHVSGDLYSVLAVWDLTDLEQMVLEGARRT